MPLMSGVGTPVPYYFPALLRARPRRKFLFGTRLSGLSRLMEEGPVYSISVVGRLLAHRGLVLEERCSSSSASIEECSGARNEVSILPPFHSLPTDPKSVLGQGSGGMPCLSQDVCSPAWESRGALELSPLRSILSLGA